MLDRERFCFYNYSISPGSKITDSKGSEGAPADVETMEVAKNQLILHVDDDFLNVEM